MKYFPKVSRGNIYLSPMNAEDYESDLHDCLELIK